eukprot:scaffold9092_cov24-Phaeocystis_antarctica.AAC.2
MGGSWVVKRNRLAPDGINYAVAPPEPLAYVQPGCRCICCMSLHAFRWPASQCLVRVRVRARARARARARR